MELELSGNSPVAAVSVERRGVLRTVFSFPVVLAALLVVLTILTVRGRFNDPDMWWHLKTGEIIWNTHSIPRVDVFSYTTNHHAYTPHEWLSQVIIFAAYHVAGYTGLMMWLCGSASLLLVGGYCLCCLYSGNAKVAFAGAFGIWALSTVGLAVRPQVLGYLLLVCELLIVRLGRTRNRHWFLLLPPLFAVWVNCHGSFFFGLIALAAILFCSFLEVRVGLLGAKRWPRELRNQLILAFALSIGALFLNPVGLSQLTYPIDALFSQQIGLKYSAEWQPAPLDDSRVWILMSSSALVLLIPLLRRVELELDELVLLGLGFWLGFQHERMLIVFGILVMPILCRLLATAWEQYEPNRDRVLPNAIMVTLALVVLFWAFPSQQRLSEQVRKANPVKALDYLNRTRITGRMLNEYVYGGYLIWAAPDRKVFVDGRADVFEWTGVLDDYTKWISLQSDPRFILDKYKIDYCVLARADPIWKVMSLLPDWKTAYSDEMSVVLLHGNKVSP